MPTITIQNNYNGSVSYNYNIFTIPELGATFPYYQGTVPTGTEVTLNLADVSGCYIHTLSVDGVNYGHIYTTPLTMGTEDMTVTCYSYDYAYAKNRVKIGDTVIFDISDASKNITANKIALDESVYDGNGQKITGTLDLSHDTVESQYVVSGYTFHDKDYASRTGTIQPLQTLFYQMSDNSSSISIAGPSYANGNITIEKSGNVTAENIRKDVKIQGVTGTYDPLSTKEYCDNGSLANKSITIYHLLSNVTSVGDYAFYNCGSLTDIDLSNVTSVGDYTFYNCGSLTDIDLSSVTSVGDYTFYGCGSLADIDLSSSTSIGTYAFYNCRSLIDLDISNVTSVRDYTFYGCSSLMNIDILNITSVGDYAFYNCGSLTNVDISSVTSIGTYAFYGCSSLTSVTSASVTTMGDWAFNHCDALTSASFTGLPSLNSGVFTNDSNLQSLNVSNASTIEGSAVYGCSSLTTMQIKNGVSYTTYGSLTTTAATIGSKTYRVKGAISVSIYDAASPSTILATVRSSSTTYTDADTGATFTWISSGKITISW